MPENNLETYPYPSDGQKTPGEMKTFFDPNLSVEERINAALGLSAINQLPERKLDHIDALNNNVSMLHNARQEEMLIRNGQSER